MDKETQFTPEKFYDFITSHIPPEKALLLLLKSSVKNYNKLKFKEGEEVHPVHIIAMAAMDMGWDIAVETEKISKDVRGLTIGTKEYMNDRKLTKIDGSK